MLTAGAWRTDTIQSNGHDGWDNSIAVGPDGDVWTAFVDPQDFGGTSVVGVPHFDGDSWNTESVGAPPGTYMSWTSIAVDGRGQPHVTFYEQEAQALRYATREGGEWRTELVDSDSGTSKFAHVAVGADDLPRISRYRQEIETGGRVRFAAFDGTA